MSLTTQQINLSQSFPPTLELGGERSYNILKGGQEVNGRTYTSTAYSVDNVQFSTIPPSPLHIIDPHVDLRFSIQLTFGGNGSGNLLQVGSNDSPRFAPLNSKLIQNLVSQINNAQVSINSNDFMSAFLRISNSPEDRISFNSTSPNMPDMSQEYSDLTGFIKNPLGSYGDGTSSDEPRGGFSQITVLSNTNTSAVVNLVFTERVILPPWAYGADNQARGFTNVQTLDWNFTLSPLQNCWSHSTSGNTITSIVGTFFAPPQLDMVFITRNQRLQYPRQLVYNYMDIQRFPNPVVTLAAGAQVVIPSNNLQLQSIPTRLVLFAREQNSDLLGDPSATDTFMNLSHLEVQWSNRNALLGAMTEQQLYEMSVKNGLNLSWSQWNKYVGSIAIIEPSSDLGLPYDQASGLLTTLQLQINATFNNKGSNSKNIVFYILVLQEGTMSTYEGESRTVMNLNVVTTNDVISSYNAQVVPYYKIEKIIGGSFFSRLSNFFRPIHDFVKKNKLVSRITSLIPHPAGKAASAVANLAGYGRRRRVVRRKKVSGGRRRRTRRRGGDLEDGDEYEEVEVDEEGNEIDPSEGESETELEEQSEEEKAPVHKKIGDRLATRIRR
jgi:hypothetical protein